MSHVQTGFSIAANRVPSVLAEMHKAHLDRIQRIKVRAVGEKAKAAAVIVEKPAAPPAPKQSWEDRQKAIPIPKSHWFSIIAMSDLTPPEPRPLLIEDIQRVTCRHFTITRNDFLSRRRDQRVAYPRHIAMYLVKTMTTKSLPEIGRRFGGRDHTTVLSGYRKIERLIKTDWLVAYDVAHVEAMLP